MWEYEAQRDLKRCLPLRGRPIYAEGGLRHRALDIAFAASEGRKLEMQPSISLVCFIAL
jgi:hypothetical protein